MHTCDLCTAAAAWLLTACFYMFVCVVMIPYICLYVYYYYRYLYLLGNITMLFVIIICIGYVST